MANKVLWSLNFVFLLWIFSMLFEFTVCSFQKPFASLAANISTTSTSNNLPPHEDPGLCDWDLTSNSWDAYWWWDYDWSSTVKSSWSSANLWYDVKQQLALPLHDCLSNTDIRDYNLNYGGYSYAGPITRLLCIYFNSYPKSNTFYDTKTTVSTDEISSIETNAQTFGTNMFTTIQTASNNYYSIGKPLFGYFTDTSSQTSTMYFPMPKPNLSGIWNYNKPALFMKTDSSKCIGELLMTQASWEGTAFNPKYYYSSFLKLITNPQNSASTVDVTATGTHYLIAADGTYSTTTTLSSTFTSGSPSTWANHVKEVYYTFTYTARSDGFLIPSAVNAQFVLQTTSYSKATQISHKFMTFFELANQSGEVYYRSGNPGYIDLDNLLVGTVSSSGAITSPKDGFLMPISTSTCITATAAANTYTTNADNTLRFNQNMTVNCYIQATDNTVATFQTLWSSPNLNSYAIFNSLSQITRVGQFGNANVNYPKDWVTVIEQDLNYGTTSYDSTKQSCTLITEVDFQVLTSKVGFPDNQNAYVVSARKKGIASTIYYNSFLTSQRIDLKVAFEFTQITDSEGSLSAYQSTSNFNWPSDLFWPISKLNSGSGFSVLSIVWTWTAVIAGIVIFG